VAKGSIEVAREAGAKPNTKVVRIPAAAVKARMVKSGVRMLTDFPMMAGSPWNRRCQ